MKINSHIKSTIKSLPILGVILLGAALVPATSIASNAERGYGKEKVSHNKGRTVDSAKHGGKYQGKKHAVKPYAKHSVNSYAHRSSGHYNKAPLHRTFIKRDSHGHRYTDHHDHRGHRHAHYVVNDYYHADHHHRLDPLRLLIGLHTENFDIILRD